MKCPQCVEEGKRSVVTQGLSETLGLFVPIQWDEDGNRIKGQEVTKTRYMCSNGHAWVDQEAR